MAVSLSNAFVSMPPKTRHFRFRVLTLLLLPLLFGLAYTGARGLTLWLPVVLCAWGAVWGGRAAMKRDSFAAAMLTGSSVGGTATMLVAPILFFIALGRSAPDWITWVSRILANNRELLIGEVLSGAYFSATIGAALGMFGALTYVCALFVTRRWFHLASPTRGVGASNPERQLIRFRAKVVPLLLALLIASAALKFGWPAKKGLEEKRIVGQLARLGVTAESFQRIDPYWRYYLVQQLGERFEFLLIGAWNLHVQYNLSREDWKRIGELTGDLEWVEDLDVTVGSADDGYLETLADQLQKIDYGYLALDLSGCRVGDAEVTQIVALRDLRSVTLDSSDITDTGLLRLGENPSLWSVSVRDTLVTKSAVARLLAAHREMRVFYGPMTAWTMANGRNMHMRRENGSWKKLAPLLVFQNGKWTPAE